MATPPSTDLQVRQGPDQASASPVALSAETKQKITNAIVQHVLDETGTPPQAFRLRIQAGSGEGTCAP